MTGSLLKHLWTLICKIVYLASQINLHSCLIDLHKGLINLLKNQPAIKSVHPTDPHLFTFIQNTVMI